jgi:mRNA interferase MazF
MGKEFTKWHKIKTGIDSLERVLFFHERDVWWCSIGLNVGFEQDGKGDDYERPVLILKKYNLQSFLGVPLTTIKKEGKYYFPLELQTGVKNVLILSQIRLFSAKRLINKLGQIDKLKFLEIKKALKTNIID